MSNERPPMSQRVTGFRDRVSAIQERAQLTLVWQVWDRMLEIEFVDRGVALAGKAFASFGPLVIVVAAFMPEHIRDAIYSTITHRLGFEGDALISAKEAFRSSDDVRRATGILGLILMVFYATSFTTALQRAYLRAWRRPPGNKIGAYTRGTTWYLVIVIYLAALGGLRALLSDGPQIGLFAVVSLMATFALWWFTAWEMLMRQVRWRVLAPSGAVTAVALSGYAVSATLWMPRVVTDNESQFGFIGVALALVTWFSGAATCVLVGACVGPVVAADPGRLGALIRGPERSLLVAGAEPSLPAPTRSPAVREALRPNEDESSTS